MDFPSQKIRKRSSECYGLGSKEGHEALSEKTRVELLAENHLLKQRVDELKHGYREAAIGLCYLDRDLRYVQINEWLAAVNGVSVEDHIGRTLSEVLPGLAAAGVEREMRGVLETGNPVINGTVYAETPAHPTEKRLYQHSYYSHKSAEGKPLGVSCLVEDITERRASEIKTQRLLEEKEVLLREMHHRVKNNLQVITSLLRLHARKVSGRETLEALASAQNRIQAIAMLHEVLHQADNLVTISGSVYIEQVIAALARLRTTPHRVRLTSDIADVSLHIEDAAPIGLIVSELVTNAFTHGFPDDRAGEVRVSMRQVEETALELVVSDDGVGLSEEIDLETIESMGLQLVAMLTRTQLGGTLDISSESGTTVTVNVCLSNTNLSGQGNSWEA